jgi:hypothetical protein
MQPPHRCSHQDMAPTATQQLDLPEYGNEIDEELFMSKEYGPGLARTKFGKNLPLWDDIVLWNDKYQEELDAGLKIGKDYPEYINNHVISLVKKYWDCFYKDGAARPIRGIEFIIDTVCCRRVHHHDVIIRK